MTQYLLSVHHDFAADIDRDEAAQNEAFAKVGAFNAALMEAGQFVYACGLTAPADARRALPDGTIQPGSVHGAPFMGGFWIVKAADAAAADALAAQAAAACGHIIEVRALQG